ncbi:MAG: alpha/beta hydrolase [Deltaproteobacteria bacterium]|nr:MAG: alpha/beta hydrolase [Deltaproteobacteria bacterium]
MSSKKVRLLDGRSLGFLECGDPAGKPIFYFHGFPGSRLEVQLADSAALGQNIRLIGIDRPGYGISDDRPERTIIDWPDDVTELADTLGINRFSVLGVSGGGPYAAACAYKIPRRLISVGIVCGLGPIDATGVVKDMLWFNRFGLIIAAHVPWFVKLIMTPLSILLRHHANKIVAYLSRSSKEPDRTALKQPEIINILSDTFNESVRHGAAGAVRDTALYANPWGFDLQDIQMQVHLWHGQRDDIIPISMARYVSKTIPNCRATFYQQEGHFSLVVKYMAEILHRLTI